VAFPAISTGIFGYPMELAASTAVTAARESAQAPVELVRFVLFDDAALEIYRREVER
jgi:O-acetyl-ADP-ribose deacetylase (regulator of RNase III)